MCFQTNKSKTFQKLNILLCHFFRKIISLQIPGFGEQIHHRRGLLSSPQHYTNHCDSTSKSNWWASNGAFFNATGAADGSSPLVDHLIFFLIHRQEDGKSLVDDNEQTPENRCQVSGGSWHCVIWRFFRESDWPSGLPSRPRDRRKRRKQAARSRERRKQRPLGAGPAERRPPSLHLQQVD